MSEFGKVEGIHCNHNGHDENVDHSDPVDYGDHVDHDDHDFGDRVDPDLTRLRGLLDSGERTMTAAPGGP